MKYFIKRTADYTAKNKLQELLKLSLDRIDCTLHDSKKDAENTIHLVCETTMHMYKGRALPPRLNRREHNDGSGQIDFWIAGVHLSLYPVKNT